MKHINVAVAVIQYKDMFLLGFRHAKQHQGNRYEFVGGKIEPQETAIQALAREVNEEIGLDISASKSINRLGVLRHIYDELDQVKEPKTVCLHVYRVMVTTEQYAEFCNRPQGCEGQALCWVDKSALLSGQYPLPEANTTILTWLALPDRIAITKALTEVGVSAMTEESAITAWVDFYSHRLIKGSCVYARLKRGELEQQQQAITELASRRPDLKLIVSQALIEHVYPAQLPPAITAQHLTHAALNQLVSDDYKVNDDLAQRMIDLPITISCHHEHSIKKANQLAGYLLNNKACFEQKQLVVTAVFISPVNKTKTHDEQPALGYEQFKHLASMAKVPVIGLGGLSPEDLPKIRQYLGDKVAGIRKFLAVDAQQ